MPERQRCFGKGNNKIKKKKYWLCKEYMVGEH